MSYKQSIQFSLIIHLILLNLVIIEWVLFWYDLNPVTRIGFGAVSTGVLISTTNKISMLYKAHDPVRHFTITLIACSLWTIVWLGFESKDANTLTEFSLAVLLVECGLYGLFNNFKRVHVLILGLNLVLLSITRIFPSIAMGYFETTAKITWFFRIEALLCWVVALGSVLYMLYHKSAIFNAHKQNKEQAWYGNLFGLISHNIRTPLATMSNIIEVVKFQKKEGVDTVTLPLATFERLEQSSQKATHVINELLNTQTLDVLKDQEVQSMSNFLTEWAVEQHHASVVVFQADYLKQNVFKSQERLGFKIALDVLIDNSVKYGASELKIYAAEPGLIVVQDDGSGMTMEQLNQYGTPFNSTNSSGAGLGTFFAKQVLLNSGWTMKAKQCKSGALIELRKRSSEEILPAIGKRQGISI